MKNFEQKLKKMVENHKKYPDEFCDCAFVLIVRGDDDVPYCGSCGKPVEELMQK